MLVWYVALSIAIVSLVFQSSGIDYRLVAVGSLLPLAADLPLRRMAYGHTLVASVGLLVVVMLATVGRTRLLRRRLLCLPIGAFCGLVLSGAWAHPDVFWWPLGGATVAHVDLLPGAGLVALEEVVGLAVCVWLVQRFGLTDRGRRDEFLRTGRLQAPATSSR